VKKPIVTRAAIRKFWDHGKGTRRVHIFKDGRVTIFGSPDWRVRDLDTWREARHVSEYRIDVETGEMYLS